MKNNRSLASKAQVDLIPMIDVVFQLILFFLVSTTFAVMPAISLKLPSSSTAENSDVKELTISITASENIYLNDGKVSMTELDSALKEFDVGDTERVSYPVGLEADEVVTNGTIVKVFDILRKNGFSAVNLRTLDK